MTAQGPSGTRHPEALPRTAPTPPSPLRHGPSPAPYSSANPNPTTSHLRAHLSASPKPEDPTRLAQQLQDRGALPGTGEGPGTPRAGKGGRRGCPEALRYTVRWLLRLSL